MDKIGRYLLDQAEFMKYMILRKEYQNGYRYSISELQNLKECVKQDYFDEILAYDERVSE